MKSKIKRSCSEDVFIDCIQELKDSYILKKSDEFSFDFNGDSSTEQYWRTNDETSQNSIKTSKSWKEEEKTNGDEVEMRENPPKVKIFQKQTKS